VIYAIETIHLSPQLRHVVMSNPIAAILEQARYAVIDPNAPGAAEAVGGWARLGIPIGLSLAVVALGWIVFTRSAPDLAERL